MNTTTLAPRTNAPATDRIVEGMAMADYLAAPGLSKHELDLFAECPEKYQLKQAGLLDDKASDPMLFGRAVHAAVFEARRDYVVQPAEYDPGTGVMTKWHGSATVCKAWTRAHKNFTILTAAEEALLGSIVRTIHLNSYSSGLLRAGRAELSLFATDPDTGLALKGRPDWVSADWRDVVDLKTIKSAVPKKCRKEVNERRYHVQAAFYFKLLRLLGKEPRNFYFIFVETGGAVPLLNVRKLGLPSLSLGDAILKDELERFASCQRRDVWPGYSGETGGIEDVDVPDWAFHAGDENEILEM